MRDANTRTVTDNGKEKIKLELRVGDCVLYVKDSDKIRDQLLTGIKEVTRNSSAKFEFGKYRGFEVFVERTGFFSGTDGFRLCIKGADGHEFRPSNLAYSFEDKLSLTGLFQRMDNFLAKGFDEWVGAQRKNTAEERGELETVMSALNKEFPQKAELALVRENHAAVIRELQHMQDDPAYVSEWQPKTLLVSNQGEIASASMEQQPKLTYGSPEQRTEYTVSSQHNGMSLIVMSCAVLIMTNRLAPSARVCTLMANGTPQPLYQLE